MAAQVARALVHLEAHTILHRDIKPANVLLDECGRPRCHMRTTGLRMKARHARAHAARGLAGMAWSSSRTSASAVRSTCCRTARPRRGSSARRSTSRPRCARCRWLLPPARLRAPRGALSGAGGRAARRPAAARAGEWFDVRRTSRTAFPTTCGASVRPHCTRTAVLLPQCNAAQRTAWPRTGCGGLAARRGGWRLGSAGSHPAPLSASLVATAGRPRRRLSFCLRVRARRASHRAGCAGAQGAWRTRWRCSRHRTSPAVSPRS